ncbi:hypothetical protein NEMIN01_2399 [Nematocida minor]|uniref:uncharacterized protein n=1 Tax=Nematocida minor TaxID=1912983 RepID=UPI00221EA61E|nr:uncharacterized protein NEMIN01_2399 [Nematocida minor]KAI5193071.1 hypothetical protein NEMIN01_2399 [Nematocida minor]
MIEAILKIKAWGIMQKCKSIKTTDNLLKYDAPKDYINILNHIFGSGNIEVECAAGAEEASAIAAMVKNRIRQYFAYNSYGVAIMNNLYSELKGGNEEEIAYWAICLINEAIRQNTLIYSPECGMHKQVDENKPLENIEQPDKSIDHRTRTYTLQIDAADSLGLKVLLGSTAESALRDLFFSISTLVHSKSLDINILKKYLTEKKLYTLNKLYTPDEENSTLLVDSGLKLVYTKYHNLADLVEKVEELENSSSDRELILDRVSNVLTQNELALAISIFDNIDEIKEEKTVQKGILDAIEYIASSTDRLNGPDGQKVLKINTDLTEFYEEYIDGDRGLYSIVNGRKDELVTQINNKKTIRKEKITARDQAINEKKSDAVINELACSIDKLDNEIYSLECSVKKERLQLDNIKDNLASLTSIKQIQKYHIVKKIEEEALRKGVKTEVVLKFFFVRIPREDLVKNLPMLENIFVVAMGAIAVLIIISSIKNLVGSIKTGLLN